MDNQQSLTSDNFITPTPNNTPEHSLVASAQSENFPPFSDQRVLSVDSAFRRNSEIIRAQTDILGKSKAIADRIRADVAASNLREQMEHKEQMEIAADDEHRYTIELQRPLRLPMYMAMNAKRSNTVRHGFGQEMFWRVVKSKIEQPHLVNDERVDAVCAAFPMWVTKEWFNEPRNCKQFMRNLQHALESVGHNIHKVHQMLGVMTDLGFTPMFARLVNSVQIPELMDALTDTINRYSGGIPYDDLMDAFEKWEVIVDPDAERYDTDATSETEASTENAYSRKAVEAMANAVNQIEHAEQEIEDLQQELAMVTDAKNKIELKMRAELKKLTDEHERLKESKQQLAMSSAETINQLRDYLRQYQEAVAPKDTNSMGNSEGRDGRGE